MKKVNSTHLINTELLISCVLRFGVILCATIISFGVFVTWINPRALHRFSTETLPALTQGHLVSDGDIPRKISQFFTGIAEFSPAAIISLGLFLLILLPIARVALTVILFLLERDFTFFCITLFVFCVLLFGLFFGKAL